MSNAAMPPGMRPELASLIAEYQRNVAEACRLLRAKLHIEGDLLHAWFQRDIPSVGWLDSPQTIRFRFHGIGCRVTFGRVVVDFDFGPNGRHDGFDAWRLSLFAASVPEFVQFRDADKLGEELAALEKTGSLVHLTQSLGSHLYYIAPALG